MEKFKKRQEEIRAKASDLLEKAGNFAKEIDGFFEAAEIAKKEYYRLVDEGERQLAGVKLDAVKPLKKKAASLVEELKLLKELFAGFRADAGLLSKEAVGYLQSEEKVFKIAERNFNEVQQAQVGCQDLPPCLASWEKKLDGIIAKFA